MAIKSFSTGEVLTASDTNVYLANAGLVYVTSTTVGSGVTSVTVSNCFSSTYDNYRIVLSNIDTNVNGDVLSLQMTLAGTAATTNYAGNTFYVSTGTVGGLTNASLSAYFEVASASATGNTATAFDIFMPAIATYTRLVFTPSCDETYFRFGAGIHKTATAYDGFKLTDVAGAMTGGTVTVYGYRKA